MSMIVHSKRCQALGPLSFHEIAVLVVFCLLVLLWFFRYKSDLDLYLFVYCFSQKKGRVSDYFLFPKEAWLYSWLGFSPSVGKLKPNRHCLIHPI